MKKLLVPPYLSVYTVHTEHSQVKTFQNDYTIVQIQFSSRFLDEKKTILTQVQRK